MRNKAIVICDIDNCFVDSREWVQHVPDDSKATSKQEQREMWDKFQSLSFLVKPNQPVIDFVVALAEFTPIFFVTAREDRKNSRENTIRQIEKFSNGKIKIGDKHALYMREEFDYRPSAQVKEELLLKLKAEGYTPICAIDDEDANCKMFAGYCIPVKRYDINTNTFDNDYVIGRAS